VKTKLILCTLSLALTCILIPSGTAQSPSPSTGKKPNIVIIWGDDIGQSNISAYSHGLMGYRTPNIDRVAHEGVMFTAYYDRDARASKRSIRSARNLPRLTRLNALMALAR
jgi:arylsulfatase